jgi:hypothetical protein
MAPNVGSVNNNGARFADSLAIKDSDIRESDITLGPQAVLCERHILWR